MKITVTIINGDFRGVGVSTSTSGQNSATEEAVREAIVQYNRTAYAQTKWNLPLARALDLDELIDWCYTHVARVTVDYDFDA